MALIAEVETARPSLGGWPSRLKLVQRMKGILSIPYEQIIAAPVGGI